MTVSRPIGGLLTALVAGAIAVAVPGVASAQDFPSKPIIFVAPGSLGIEGNKENGVLLPPFLPSSFPRMRASRECGRSGTLCVV